MHVSQSHEITLSDILGTLWRYRLRFLATAVVVLCAAVAYAVFVPPVWEASQAIVVRDNAAMHFGPTARARTEQDTKVTQQTLQEMVFSWSLLKNVLQKLGPPQDATSTDPWPSDKAVDGLRGTVSLVPPKGSEFGKTDVFYLKVKDPSRDRSLRLTEAIYADLEKAFGELQATLAQSEIAELKESVVLAENNLSQATQRLAQIEKEAGVDLVALRMLHQSPTGDTHIFRALTGVLDELRQTKATQSQHTAMLAMLKKAEKNPLLMTAAPRELLECHTGLSRLLQGLTESRLRGFEAASRLTEEHCDVRALRREENGVRDAVRKELATAIEGVSAAQELTTAKRAMLEAQVAALNVRVTRLTEMRAEYSNLVSQVEQRRGLVEESQRNLSQARAAFTAATSSSIISRMDLPDGGLHPVSPSRTMIGLGGLLASILGGAGVVLLTAPVKRHKEQLSAAEATFAEAPRRLRRPARHKVRQHAEVVVAGDNNH